MEKNKILAIIPARAGSKGITGKNLKKLCGIPLIDYTINAAKKSRFLSYIIVSSDDQKIIAHCLKKGIAAPFVRPARLAGDSSPMIDVIKHALLFLKKKKNIQFSYVIILQPTSPLRTAKHIDEALEKLFDSDADSIVSVVEVPHAFTPDSLMEFDGKILKHCRKPDERKLLRQKNQKFYGRNGPAILAFKTDCLLKHDTMYGAKILPYFMDKQDSIDIDDNSDFAIAQALIKARNG